MHRDTQARAALAILASALLIAALTSAAKASATVVVGSGWRAVSATLGPREHVRLTCPKGYRGTGFDAAQTRPFTLARGQWIDGGESMRFDINGKRIAVARPSQTFGLSSVAFKSYARAVDVEVICES